MTDDLHLTRRRLVQVGGASTALVALGGLGRAAGIAAAAVDRRHFSRASYLTLGDRMFDAATPDGATSRLKLTDVADLARARTEPGFAGRDDAFALTFTGPGSRPLPAGITTLRNSVLGEFELFLAPAGAATDVRTYELVVDRSVPVGDVLADAPRPMAQSNAADATPPVAAAVPAPVGTAEGTAPAKRPKAKPRRILAATIGRRGGTLAADVRVAKGRGTVAVRVSVLRGDAVLARGAERLRGRVGVRVTLSERRRLPKGDYTLAVTTVDKAGRRATTRRRVTL